MEPQTPEKKVESSVETSPSVSDNLNNQNRRSSSRSIKRKRFDDEIVEYSLGTPPGQFKSVGRYRTLSQTNAQGTEPAESAVTPDSDQPQTPTSTTVANTAANTGSTNSSSTNLALTLPAPSALSIPLTLPPQVMPITGNSAASSVAAPTVTFPQSPAVLTAARNKPEVKMEKLAINTNINRGQTDSSATKSSFIANENSTSRSAGIASINSSIDTNSSTSNQDTSIQDGRNNTDNTSLNLNKTSTSNDNDNNRNTSAIRSKNNVYQKDHSKNSSFSAIRNPSENIQDENSNNNQENTTENISNNVDSNIASSKIQNSVSNSATNSSTPHDKRRAIKSVSTSKKSKKNRMAQQLTTKDLGRWKPIDDLSLVVGIQQTNDLRIVHRGVKFSCKFTIQEMQNRWYSLLYDEPISRIAVAAMRNLHPELVAGVHSRALFTTQEEELLGTIKSTDNPTLETFQLLLNKNALNFYPARMAKSLMNHWNLMKQYTLLPDQVINNTKNPRLFSSLPDGDCNINFSDQEDKINDGDLVEPRDEALELELALGDRKQKKEIRHLENELPRWTVLVDSITGIGNHPEFDNQTLAVLRGRLVRYLMRSREIVLGRKSKHEEVDVDLNLEGPAYKVSRRQGAIKLRSNGDFFITNEGKRPMFIDGMPLLQGNKAKLNNNCTIEISGLRLVFLVNIELVNAIRQESAKMNGPLN